MVLKWMRMCVAEKLIVEMIQMQGLLLRLALVYGYFLLTFLYERSLLIINIHVGEVANF